jgi:hypothetical protein
MKLFGKTILMATCILPVYANATSTICSVELDDYDVLGIEVIAWDDKKRTATVSDGFRKNQKGIVTSVRKHNDGEKVNILIKYSDPHASADEAELIIFPIGEDDFRVIGVRYSYNDGHRLLDSLIGNQAAKCKSV